MSPAPQTGTGPPSHDFAMPTMADLAPEQLRTALADVIRDQLAGGNDVYVPGLGTFALIHQGSRIEELAEDKVAIHPPHNKIVFTPAS